jgi:hypothetical protein
VWEAGDGGLSIAMPAAEVTLSHLHVEF